MEGDTKHCCGLTWGQGLFLGGCTVGVTMYLLELLATRNKEEILSYTAGWLIFPWCILLFGPLWLAWIEQPEDKSDFWRAISRRFVWIIIFVCAVWALWHFPELHEARIVNVAVIFEFGAHALWRLAFKQQRGEETLPRYNTSSSNTASPNSERDPFVVGSVSSEDTAESPL